MSHHSHNAKKHNTDSLYRVYRTIARVWNVHLIEVELHFHQILHLNLQREEWEGAGNQWEVWLYSKERRKRQGTIVVEKGEGMMNRGVPFILPESYHTPVQCQQVGYSGEDRVKEFPSVSVQSGSLTIRARVWSSCSWTYGASLGSMEGGQWVEEERKSLKRDSRTKWGVESRAKARGSEREDRGIGCKLPTLQGE